LDLCFSIFSYQRQGLLEGKKIYLCSDKVDNGNMLTFYGSSLFYKKGTQLVEILLVAAFILKISLTSFQALNFLK
jgi:hypothetical protein